MELRMKLPFRSMQSTVQVTARGQLTNAGSFFRNTIHRLSMLLPMQMGTWCSGITSASHAEGPGFKSQCVHFSKLLCNPNTMFRSVLRVPLLLAALQRLGHKASVAPRANSSCRQMHGIGICKGKQMGTWCSGITPA